VNQTLLSLSNVSSADYSFYSYSYTACGPSATVTFVFRHDVDTWSLDDVAVSNGTHNLIVNGGFEMGNLTGWNYSNPSNTASHGRAAHASAPYFPRTGTYFYVDRIYQKYDYLSQTFATVPTATYNISFWLYSTAASSEDDLIISSQVLLTSR
jgi:hypothetical protein